MPVSYFEDTGFMDLVISLCCKDVQFLRDTGGMLKPEDFKPQGKQKISSKEAARWLTAKAALDHWQKYRAPIQQLLTAELLQVCKGQRLSSEKQEVILEYARRVIKRKVTSVDSITDKVLEFKQEVSKAQAVAKLIALQSRNELTDEKWAEICQEALDVAKVNQVYETDYFKDYKQRIQRRRMKGTSRFPMLMIEPLDMLVKAIGRGHFGIVIAPYKRGKSLMLIHIAVAYVLQRLNVLYITLEDPVEDVEDRFDANVSQLPIGKLANMPKTFRERFERFSRLIRTRLQIVDRTEARVSVADIDAIYEEYRNKGFIADAIIIDYDDEIKAKRANQDRRHELADVYRDLRHLAGKKKAIVWSAAQTKRGTQGLKILGGDHLADDISKVRKAMIAIGMGQGEWGEESIYLHIAAHKFDKQFVGCNIVTNKDRMILYDRERTAKASKEYANKKKALDDDLAEDLAL